MDKNEFKLRIYKYVIRIVKLLSKIPHNNVINEIVKQTTRSGCSVGANYFEAIAASSRKDFQNYFHISLKSANETKFWLAVLIDSGYLNIKCKTEGGELLKETKEIANILAASLITMKKK